MTSFVMSQVTLTHAEAALCRDVSKARPSFVFRNPAFGEVLLCKQMRMRRGWRSLKVHADASGAQVFDTAQTLDFETKQLEKLPVLDFEAKQREKLQSLDFETQQFDRSKSQNKLKIGLVGFGNYGQFLAERMVKLGHTVLAHSRSDYTQIARKLKVQFFRDADDFCEEHPEVIVLCTSILSTEAVLNALPVQRLRRSTLFVDVLSVKEFPKNLLLQVLPTDFDILCTHPMFGPQSGTGSWSTLPFMFDKVRVGSGSREKRCEKYLNIFSGEGCRMVEMSCEEHDRHAASSQFITHTMGRVLGKLDLKSTPINTMGYETLLNLVNYTRRNSFDLYYGLFMYNVNATEELDRLELAFDAVKKQLFSQLHNVLRSQLIDRGNAEEATAVPSTSVDKTERVPVQLVQLKEAANKLDMCLELNSSVHGEIHHH